MRDDNLRPGKLVISRIGNEPCQVQRGDKPRAGIEHISPEVFLVNEGILSDDYKGDNLIPPQLIPDVD